MPESAFSVSDIAKEDKLIRARLLIDFARKIIGGERRRLHRDL
jgi:hypothetical protein